MIQEFQLTSPEGDLDTYLLADPAVNRSCKSFYRSPDGLDFHRDEVLNHRVGAAGILHRGDVMEGLLLAGSFMRIPNSYAHRSIIRLCLLVVDQFDDVEELLVELDVDRSAEHA